MNGINKLRDMGIAGCKHQVACTLNPNQ